MKNMSFNQDLKLEAKKNNIFKKFNNTLEISVKEKLTFCYSETSQ